MRKSLIAAALATALPVNAMTHSPSPAEDAISRDTCISLSPTEAFCSSASREPFLNNEHGSTLYIIPDGYLQTPAGRRENCTLLVDENYKVQEQPFCASPSPQDLLLQP